MDIIIGNLGQGNVFTTYLAGCYIYKKSDLSEEILASGKPLGYINSTAEWKTDRKGKDGEYWNPSETVISLVRKTDVLMFTIIATFKNYLFSVTH